MSILLDSVVLLFLAPWILLTLLAIYLGWKLGKKLSTGLFWRWFGAFLGFMLLMGGWIVWWRIEYLMNLRYAEEMCKEAGVEIYVTPAQWIEMVGGEEEWKKMPYDFQSSPQLDSDIPEILQFQGEKYNLSYQVNNRVFIYTFEKNKFYTRITSDLYHDILSNIFLFKRTEVFTGAGAIANSPDGFKFWINDIPDCKANDQGVVFDFVFREERSE